jgi:hypothetical protein
MATLNNPVNAQNIVDRFADFVVATANSGISWGTNSIPTYWNPKTGVVQLIPTPFFGGPISGKLIGISAPNSVYNGTTINAANIYNFLLAETNQYTSIRFARARLIITGTGRRDTPSGDTWPVGTVYDTTAVAYLSTSYQIAPYAVSQASIAPGVATGQVIRRPTLEGFFSNLTAYYTAARNIVQDFTVVICHASCHSSCHSSRGRR